MAYDNCTKCPAIKVLSDPDPIDWFCDDDVKAICSHTKKEITSSCRPTSLERECKTPEWCPIKD